MSLAVMNWVWANSPTSGNERLVLLALADACSRDHGPRPGPGISGVLVTVKVPVMPLRAWLGTGHR
jgi:hypothetical protein